MERRILTKALWAAAVVMIAVGALGQGVLAEKPPPPPVYTAKTVLCDAGGLVVADVTIEVGAFGINVLRDRHTGADCFDLMRDVAIDGFLPAGDAAMLPIEPTETLSMNFQRIDVKIP